MNGNLYAQKILLQDFDGSEAVGKELRDRYDTLLITARSIDSLIEKAIKYKPKAVVFSTFSKSNNPKQYQKLFDTVQNLPIRVIAINPIENPLTSSYDLLRDGADEVLSSRVCPREAAFRIILVMRRGIEPTKDILHRGRNKLFYTERLLAINNLCVKLSERETHVLKVLFSQRRMTVENISSEISQSSQYRISQNACRVILFRARRKVIEQTGRDIIENRYSMGYAIRTVD